MAIRWLLWQTYNTKQKVCLGWKLSPIINRQEKGGGGWIRMARVKKIEKLISRGTSIAALIGHSRVRKFWFFLRWLIWFYLCILFSNIFMNFCPKKFIWYDLTHTVFYDHFHKKIIGFDWCCLLRSDGLV